MKKSDDIKKEETKKEPPSLTETSPESEGLEPRRVFASQSVWGQDELLEQIGEIDRANRVLRKKAGE